MNALDQPRNGYTYITDVKPATRASLSALRDLLVKMKQSEAAYAVERAITACHEATANLHAVDLASFLDVDPTAEEQEIAGDIATFGMVEHTPRSRMLIESGSVDAKDWQDQVSELRGGL